MAPIGGSQHHLPCGALKDTTIQYLVERAKGGFGLIFTGAYGTKLFAQITMGLGRIYPNLPAPSSVHVFRHPGETSPELTRDEIKSKIDSVIKASKIAKDSGFSVLRYIRFIGDICLIWQRKQSRRWGFQFWQAVV